MHHHDALLAALRAAVGLGGTAEFPAERVRTLGAALGLADEPLALAVETLAERGALRLGWGGKVTVLPPAPAAPAAGAGVSINAPFHGDLVFQPNSPHATAGRGAVGAGARVGLSGEELARLVGSLAAVQARLREVGPELGDGGAARAEAAAAATGDAVAELRKDEPDKPALQGHLETATKAVEEAGKLAGAVGKLGPVYGQLRGALDAALAWFTPG